MNNRCEKFYLQWEHFITPVFIVGLELSSKLALILTNIV